MTALLWLVAAMLLVIAEMFVGDLVLLMLGGGALATAGVSFAFDTPIWVDGVVFAVTSVLLLGVVRPVARRHMLNRPAVLTNTEALEGRHAVVTERVDEHDGRVKIGGDVWSARTLDPGEVIEPGMEVTVVQIDGATAVVWKG
ncbi:NfeD family protein [Gordonia sp. HNM0687]|uniref:NfeD family protein n=1 Tax=Gordonia mangrovi TaxID=2665643 RepID=A0A6L7GQF8_9ACTN|nr:NfeD family protein [Gordonia mangrovi]MDY6810902.1 NfeD family protein [Actinomycetota bacterium]MXP22179.1 NfeD family protein [Gordonia mangrovi]UVF77913.1 NfeD family protein [Gordonia mangrovi]